MGADRKDVHDLLEKVGAKKIRQNKHAVWELPGGRRVTVPTTPSDPQTWSKTYSRIQRLIESPASEPVEAEMKPVAKKKVRPAAKQPRPRMIMLPEESVPPKQDLKAQLKAVLPKIQPKPVPPPAPPSPPKPVPRPRLDPAKDFERQMLQFGVKRKDWTK